MEEWSKFKKGIFLVNVLGIMYNPKTGKILIGKRENDPYIKKLSWVFPGGRPGYGEELDKALVKILKKKTGIRVKKTELVFAKTYPEKREFLSLYYYCEASGNAKPGDDIVEAKWVKPVEVRKYFTTSLHPKLFAYLKKL